jgi:hypothetical protein
LGDPQGSIEIVATDDFVRWWQALPEREHDAVYDAVSLLEQFGTGLPFPHSSALESTSLPLRELRRKSGKHQLRVIYIFDHVRQAVLLIGGDKLGTNQKLFYKSIIARAETIWAQYLAEQEARRP